MEFFHLLPSQKNDVFKEIQLYKFDPLNFEWTEGPTYFHDYGPMFVPRLVYTNSKFYYQFDKNPTEGKHFAIFSPGEDTITDQVYVGSWKTQLERFRYWLNYLHREVDKPDLWTEISKYQPSLESELEPDVSNDPFTVFQYEQLKSGIDKVRDYIKENISPTEEQFKAVNERLDYLIDSAKRQGRKDWIYAAIGVIFTIAYNLALSPEQAGTIWSLIKNAVSGIIHFLT